MRSTKVSTLVFLVLAITMSVSLGELAAQGLHGEPPLQGAHFRLYSAASMSTGERFELYLHQGTQSDTDFEFEVILLDLLLPTNPGVEPCRQKVSALASLHPGVNTLTVDILGGNDILMINSTQPFPLAPCFRASERVHVEIRGPGPKVRTDAAVQPPDLLPRSSRIVPLAYALVKNGHTQAASTPNQLWGDWFLIDDVDRAGVFGFPGLAIHADEALQLHWRQRTNPGMRTGRGEVTFEIRVTNAGPSTASGAGACTQTFLTDWNGDGLDDIGLFVWRETGEIAINSSRFPLIPCLQQSTRVFVEVEGRGLEGGANRVLYSVVDNIDGGTVASGSIDNVPAATLLVPYFD